jgi:crossover junction endodeoxyribonuclease RuvC
VEISISKRNNNTEKISSEKIILGVDPGTNVLGYGLLKVLRGKILLIEMGVIHLSSQPNHHEKLKKIFSRLRTIIKNHKPVEVAIEAPFFGKNVQSMLKLGRAQGVAITVAMMESLPVFEYSPKKIKQSITGNGNASKEQVASMLKHLLALKDTHEYLDATDALAAAVCHHFQGNSFKNGEKKFSGWKDFVQANPKRVKGVK